MDIATFAIGSGASEPNAKGDHHTRLFFCSH
jgi:hypothetical protein